MRKENNNGTLSKLYTNFLLTILNYFTWMSTVGSNHLPTSGRILSRSGLDLHGLHGLYVLPCKLLLVLCCCFPVGVGCCGWPVLRNQQGRCSQLWYYLWPLCLPVCLAWCCTSGAYCCCCVLGRFFCCCWSYFVDFCHW